MVKKASEPGGTESLRAHLVIQRGGGGVGPGRIELLRAIGELGSISAGGRKVGLTFRGAWDAVQALNDLFGAPLIVSRAGGARGGGAELTELGRRVLTGYDKLDEDLRSLMALLEGDARGEAPESREPAIWSLGMKTSARNALRGEIETLTEGAVNAEVTLRVGPQIRVTATITRSSVAALGLAPGREALALIKANFVILAPAGEELRTSAGNLFRGTVVRHEVGAVNDEVVLRLDGGSTLAAIITRESGSSLCVSVGSELQALVSASHVIVAVD